MEVVETPQHALAVQHRRRRVLADRRRLAGHRIRRPGRRPHRRSAWRAAIGKTPVRPRRLVRELDPGAEVPEPQPWSPHPSRSAPPTGTGTSATDPSHTTAASPLAVRARPTPARTPPPERSPPRPRQPAGTARIDPPYAPTTHARQPPTGIPAAALSYDHGADRRRSHAPRPNRTLHPGHSSVDRSVLTRSPLGRSSFDGAATWTSTPAPRRTRARPNLGRTGLVDHPHRTRQAHDPGRHISIRRRQPPLQELAGRAVQSRGDHRACVHIETRTRTLNNHWGALPQLWLYGQANP